MISTRDLAFSFSLVVLSAALGQAQGLSTYRGFQFGMTLVEVAKQTGMRTSEAKTLHQHPAMIQELWWQHPFRGSSPQTDPVSEVVFSFFNGNLFRMVVSYDYYRTEGLTDDEMIEILSKRYGIAERPVATMIRFSSSQIYNDQGKVIARWENSRYSCDLFRSSNQPALGMLIVSKRLDARAQAAIIEAMRLDNQETPQIDEEHREMDDGASPEKIE